MRVRLIFYGGSASVASLVGLQCTGSQPGPPPTLSASSSTSSQTSTITISKQHQHHCLIILIIITINMGFRELLAPYWAGDPTSKTMRAWRSHRFIIQQIIALKSSIQPHTIPFLATLPYISFPLQKVAWIRPCCVIYCNSLPTLSPFGSGLSLLIEVSEILSLCHHKRYHVFGVGWVPQDPPHGLGDHVWDGRCLRHVSSFSTLLPDKFTCVRANWPTVDTLVWSCCCRPRKALQATAAGRTRLPPRPTGGQTCLALCTRHATHLSNRKVFVSSPVWIMSTKKGWYNFLNVLKYLFSSNPY